MPSPSRDHALAQLDSLHLPGWRPHLLSRRIPSPTDPRDHALAEQIIIGTIKNVLLLQHLVSYYSGRRPKSIDPLVQKILAVALFQLRFLTRVPASAVVDEAVEQARQFGRSKATGFVNAVLRGATRNPNPPLPPRSDAREYARICLSHPPELFSRLCDLLGEADALRFCEHDNIEPPTTVRLFAGRSADELTAPGVTVTAHEQPSLFVVDPAKVPGLADWARRGIAQAQDPTAALAADALDLHPGQFVLDRCAGLGTKTLQLREKLGDDGQLIAMDASPVRCDKLRQLVQQRGLANIQVFHGSSLADIPSPYTEGFDRVLVDAPCSNSGVLARRPEARFAQDARSLKSLERLQAEILDDTAPSVRPGGLLVYSTCSIWPAENEQVVASFISRHPEFTLIETRFTLPSLDAVPITYRDGGFTATLRRQASAADTATGQQKQLAC